MGTGIKVYSEKEETFNIITHAIGLFLSIPALILLIIYGSLYGTVWHIVSYSIYGGSLITLYLASTLYHSARNPKIRQKLNLFDHATIYILIAGTYTPFALIILKGTWSWTIFGIIWGLALLGIILKLIFSGRYDKISTFSYILMGSIIIIDINPLIENLSARGLEWLVIGAVSYFIGAVLYLLNKIPYNHAIFHVFVLLGSCSHFMAVFYHTL